MLEERVAQKKHIYEYYKKALSDIEDITMMPVQDYDQPNYWLSCIQLKDKLKPIDILKALHAHNIDARPIWKPMHLQPYYKDFDFVTLREQSDVAGSIFAHGLCLPSDTKMSDEDLSRVVEVIRGLWG